MMRHMSTLPVKIQPTATASCSTQRTRNFSTWWTSEPTLFGFCKSARTASYRWQKPCAQSQVLDLARSPFTRPVSPQSRGQACRAVTSESLTIQLQNAGNFLYCLYELSHSVSVWRMDGNGHLRHMQTVDIAARQVAPDPNQPYVSLSGAAIKVSRDGRYICGLKVVSLLTAPMRSDSILVGHNRCITSQRSYASGRRLLGGTCSL